jgi:1-acyl-sn-glycerol-3-phosphate acyltransferase
MKVSAGVILHTLITRFLLLLIMLISFFPVVIFLLLPKRWRYDNRFFCWFAYFFYRAIVKISFLPVTVVGKENISDEPAIFVANHQSSLDIPIVGSLIKTHPHIWLAKSELLISPILGFILPRIAVLIDMSTPIKGMRSLVNAVNMIYEKRRHAMIFPEGARFTDGKVHDFYLGFVILAKKTGRPIIPVRLFNLEKAYPPETFWVYRCPIHVVVGPPFYYQEGESEESCRDRVYTWFLEQKY